MSDPSPLTDGFYQLRKYGSIVYVENIGREEVRVTNGVVSFNAPINHISEDYFPIKERVVLRQVQEDKRMLEQGKKEGWAGWKISMLENELNLFEEKMKSKAA